MTDYLQIPDQFDGRGLTPNQREYYNLFITDAWKPFEATKEEQLLAQKAYSEADTLKAMRAEPDLWTDIFIHRVFKDIFLPGESVSILDLGAGTGDVLVRILEKFKDTKFTAELVEPNRHNVIESRARFEDGKFSNVSDLNVHASRTQDFHTDRLFNAITTIYSGHFTDIRKTIETYSERLLPGGKLLMMDISKSSIGVEQVTGEGKLQFARDLERVYRGINGYEGFIDFLKVSLKLQLSPAGSFLNTKGMLMLKDFHNRAKDYQNNQDFFIALARYMEYKYEDIKVKLNGQALGISETNEQILHDAIILVVEKEKVD